MQVLLQDTEHLGIAIRHEGLGEKLDAVDLVIDLEPDVDGRIVPGGSNFVAANGAFQAIDAALLPLDLDVF